MDSLEGGVYCKRYEFSFITSVKILFPDSLENDAHTRLMMIAYTKNKKNTQFSSIFVYWVLLAFIRIWNNKRTRKSLNNDDEIELSFRFNEN